MTPPSPTAAQVAAAEEIVARIVSADAIAGRRSGEARQAHWRAIMATVIAEREAAVRAEINTPEIENFIVGATREAAHQRARWGSEHDAAKGPEEWFWLVGYLAGKALRASIEGDREKALHHTISSAAALAHWHAALREAARGSCGAPPVDHKM